ncbi:glycosyltransferase family 9 protein [Malaciobacter mytili]|uniref:glycosyltransferase family 9 protein n=1 Tax=Malaciobacter mytili TaxID=603050 RepID=UPI003BAF6ADE
MKFKQKIKNLFFKKIAQKKYTKTLNLKDIKKILIIRDGGIGDAICTYPLIRELKKNLPHVEIDIYASLNNHFMYKYLPYIDNIYIKYKKRQWYKSWIDILKMRKNRYDLAIDDTVIRLHRTIYTKIINPTFVIGSSDTNKRYGFDRSELSYYYKTYNSNDIKHIVDKRLRILDLLGLPNNNNKMDFYLSKKRNIHIQKYFEESKAYKFIALNTDGSNSSRTLTKEQIITLCKLLYKKNIKIILLSIPKKYTYFEKLIKENNLLNVELPFKTNTIYDAAEIVKNVNLLISPDTSFIHIASGLNIPTIGLYWNNPIKYIEWGPRSEKSYAITPKTKEENILHINLNDVKDKAFEILESSKKSF